MVIEGPSPWIQKKKKWRCRSPNSFTGQPNRTAFCCEGPGATCVLILSQGGWFLSWVDKELHLTNRLGAGQSMLLRILQRRRCSFQYESAGPERRAGRLRTMRQPFRGQGHKHFQGQSLTIQNSNTIDSKKSWRWSLELNWSRFEFYLGHGLHCVTLDTSLNFSEWVYVCKYMWHLTWYVVHSRCSSMCPI